MEFNGVELKCPICGAWIGLRPTKSGKPHAFCNECGLEMFFRKQASIDAIRIGLKEKKTDFVRRRAS
jgi:hypothetical protein